MPSPAQDLAPVFGFHTFPKAALSISFDFAFAVVLHVIFLYFLSFSVYNMQIPAEFATTSSYIAGKIMLRHRLGRPA